MNTQYSLHLQGGDQLNYRIINGGNMNDTTIPGHSTFEVDTWNHVVATYNGSLKSLYVDGQLIVNMPAVMPIDENPLVPQSLVLLVRELIISSTVPSMIYEFTTKLSRKKKFLTSSNLPVLILPLRRQPCHLRLFTPHQTQVGIPPRFVGRLQSLDDAGASSHHPCW